MKSGRKTIGWSLLWSLSATVLAAPLDAQMLKGAVEQTDRADELQVGAKFDQTLLPPNATREFWYLVPPWAAGTWEHREVTVETSRGRSTGYDRGRETIGRQADAAGQIWDCILLPMTNSDEAASAVSVFITRNQWVDNTHPDRLCFHSTGLEIRYAKKGRKVNLKKPFDQELCFLPQTDGRILQRNRDIVAGKIMSAQCYRVAPFTPVNEAAGHDLRQSLAQFLHSTGRDDLIPAQ
ncbi:MAG TPA: hypothetical protein V6D22_19055 [Candidatus Obscuribacterales bacterium]